MKQTKGVVVGNGEPEKGAGNDASVRATVLNRKTIFRPKLIVFSAVVVIVLIAFGVWLFGQVDNNVSIYDLPESSPTSKPIAKDESPIKDPSTVVDDIQRDVDAYPKSDLSKKQKIELTNLYLSLAAAYLNNNDGYNALAAYQNAGSYAIAEQQKAVLTGKVNAYIAIGDTEQAIKTIQTLITIIENNPDPFSQRDIDAYRRQIEQLKAGENNG